MKTLLALALLSAPALACPHQDQAQKSAEQPTQTADQTAAKKQPEQKPAPAKKTDQAKAKAPEPAKKPS